MARTSLIPFTVETRGNRRPITLNSRLELLGQCLERTSAASSRSLALPANRLNRSRHFLRLVKDDAIDYINQNDLQAPDDQQP
ncbi:MAG: hypothetical protein M2R45_02372 [Verrucomicrobia subdivision 3 bacterium]|nr:hypothetical protein [Limisphaerales bacterium]MCS1414923.1 hypothetical protein [Limisphaerales bacterium]